MDQVSSQIKTKQYKKNTNLFCPQGTENCLVVPWIGQSTSDRNTEERDRNILKKSNIKDGFLPKFPSG